MNMRTSFLVGLLGFALLLGVSGCLPRRYNEAAVKQGTELADLGPLVGAPKSTAPLAIPHPQLRGYARAGARRENPAKATAGPLPLPLPNKQLSPPLLPEPPPNIVAGISVKQQVNVTEDHRANKQGTPGKAPTAHPLTRVSIGLPNRVAADPPTLAQAATIGAPKAVAALEPVAQTNLPTIGNPVALDETAGNQLAQSSKTEAPRPLGGIKQVKHRLGATPAGDLPALYRLAAESYARIDTYIVRFRRRERVGVRNNPEEVMLMKFRERPFSVYFKWLGKVGKGREVVYVQGHHRNLLHTRLAAGDNFLMPAGSRMALSPNNVLVRSKSRHSITEAGVGKSIGRFGKLVKGANRSAKRFGNLTYVGIVRRKEFPDPVEAVSQTIPVKSDKRLPRGGRRMWYFDMKLRFPVMTITFDHNGKEVEYYCFDRFFLSVPMTDEDFNPDVLFKKR